MIADKYSSLAALKEHLGKNAYRIRMIDRRAATVTIIAPHGGFIEAGSSALAYKIAGREHNLFDFQGLRRENPSELHVTATNFRDPQLTRLLHRSVTAVSIHGMGNQGTKDIWLGGLNAQLKAIVRDRLLAAGFTVNADAPRYRGESPRNVVNLAQNKGVQLEISNELWAELFVKSRFTPSGRCPKTTPRFDALASAVRESIRLYQQGLAESA
jgi:phage replication-related protein YjqB (UPF0714/DUF867 family)